MSGGAVWRLMGCIRLGFDPDEDAKPIAPARARKNFVEVYIRASRESVSSTAAHLSND